MARTIGIRVFKGDELVESLLFERDIIKIGRLASAHLRLEDPKVSRIHAVIDIAAGRDEVSIIDMGSAEGTRVNGEKISRVQLKHGDEVGLGDSRLVVVLEDADLAALTGTDTPPPAVAATAGGALTEAIPGRGQLSSLPEPTNKETDVFAPSDEGDLASLQAELASSTEAPPDTGVFSSNDHLVEDPFGPEIPLEESEPHAPAAAPPVASAAAPAQASAHPMSQPPMMVAPPLPPIPVDPITEANRHVEISLRWGGTVVEVRRIRAEQQFSIGVTDKDDLFVPLEDHGGGERHTLLERGATEGNFTLNLLPSMSGTLNRGQQSQPLKSAARGGSIELTDDVRAEIHLGYFVIEVQPVSKSVAIPIVPIFDMFLINTTLVTLFSFLAVMGVLTLLPVGLDDDDGDLMENAAQFKTLILKPPPKDNSLLKKLEKAKAKAAAAKGKKAKSGKKSVDKKSKGKMAAKKTPDKKPDDAEIVNAKLAALGLDGESGGALSKLFGDTGGSALQAALGDISGERAADAYGVGGLSTRGGTGVGGGGVGTNTLGIGRVGTVGRGTGNAAYGASTGNLGSKQDRDVKISQGRPIILGSLDKEIIRRIVREHMAQIKYCYERELTKNPGIYGKIVMKWVINGNGRVINATVAETQMKNRNVESCIGQKIRTWKFPKPKGGGIVIVNYPFVFKQSN